MWLLALFISAVAIPLAWLWIVHPVVLRNRDRKRKAGRRRASAEELLTEAKEAVRSEGWQRFRSGQGILSLESTSESGLYTSLRALWEEACEEDRKTGRSGRDSNYFELHDCGIAWIMEELQQRAGGANSHDLVT
jgi:hypothetical protein